jgi:hypothetical protein
LSSRVVISGLSAEMTHSPFYLFIENFIHSKETDTKDRDIHKQNDLSNHHTRKKQILKIEIFIGKMIYTKHILKIEIRKEYDLSNHQKKILKIEICIIKTISQIIIQERNRY